MINTVEKNEVVQFKNGDFVLDVTIDSNNETVWLNREQLSQLFDRDIKTIGKHINNALKEELDNSTIAKFATVAGWSCNSSLKALLICFSIVFYIALK